LLMEEGSNDDRASNLSPRRYPGRTATSATRSARL
jgi:hypothetical protein